MIDFKTIQDICIHNKGFITTIADDQIHTRHEQSLKCGMRNGTCNEILCDIMQAITKRIEIHFEAGENVTCICGHLLFPMFKSGTIFAERHGDAACSECGKNLYEILRDIQDRE